MRYLVLVLMWTVAAWRHVYSAESPEINFRAMGEAEKAFNERQRHRVLPLMDLDEIFEDKNLYNLAQAAGKGNRRKIGELVAKGVDVNGRGKSGATPIYSALRSQNKVGFAELLKHGATPDITFDGGNSLMDMIFEEDDLFFLQEALKYRINQEAIINEMGQTLIFKVSGTIGTLGDYGKIDLVVSAGADVNALMPDGTTPLMYAVRNSRYDRAIYLLKHGADLTLKNARGEDFESLLKVKRGISKPGTQWNDWLLRLDDFLATLPPSLAPAVR